MTDVQEEFQTKIQELRDLNQQLLEEHPELKDNYWVEKLWHKLNHQPLMYDTWDDDFKLGTSNLQEIDQAARFLNVDYELHVLYERSFPTSNVSTFVRFNLKQPYNLQKAKQQQMMFKNVNNNRLSKLIAYSIDIDMFMFFVIVTLFCGFLNVMPIWIGITSVILLAIGGLIISHQLKSIYQKIEKG